MTGRRMRDANDEMREVGADHRECAERGGSQAAPRGGQSEVAEQDLEVVGVKISVGVAV